MLLNSCVVSHPGKVRDKNEDNFLFYDLISENTNKYLFFENRAETTEPTLLGVFDGMGGASDGEIASRIAALVFRSRFTKAYNEDGEALLSDMCRRANNEICKEMKRNDKQSMGATASVMSFSGDNFVLCNIGDSPIFIFRYDRLVEISYEHTERKNLEALGEATDEKKKYKLTQHLGIDSSEMVIEPNIVPGQLKHGDRILICTDGLTDMVKKDRIGAILAERLPTSETASKLFGEAMDAGGKDNLTLMLIDVFG